MGTVDIAEREVQCKVECTGGTAYGSDSRGPLKTGDVDYSDNVYVDTRGRGEPVNLGDPLWFGTDVPVNDLHLTAN